MRWSPAQVARHASTSTPLAGQPLVEFIDLPLLRGDEAETAGYVAALQTPWPGGVAFYSSPETTGYDLEAIAAAPAAMGVTLDALTPGPAGRLDKATRVRVRMDFGELASTTRLQLLGGANLVAIRGTAGEWEVVQFETATLVAAATYELSGLLRAQAGTELAMVSAVAAGARVVVLDPAVTAVVLAPAEIGLPLNWRYGPATRDLGDESFAGSVRTFRGVGRRPLSPVHVRGTRNGGGDLTIGWIRRTRTGGDTWETTEVPLGEEAERYEIDILDGASVKRTLTATSPSVAYTASQQIVDFGSAQAAVSVRVHQTNASWGRGSAAAKVV